MTLVGELSVPLVESLHVTTRVPVCRPFGVTTLNLGPEWSTGSLTVGPEWRKSRHSTSGLRVTGVPIVIPLPGGHSDVTP